MGEARVSAALLNRRRASRFGGGDCVGALTKKSRSTLFSEIAVAIGNADAVKASTKPLQKLQLCEGWQSWKQIEGQCRSGFFRRSKAAKPRLVCPEKRVPEDLRGGRADEVTFAGKLLLRSHESSMRHGSLTWE